MLRKTGYAVPLCSKRAIVLRLCSECGDHDPPSAPTLGAAGHSLAYEPPALSAWAARTMSVAGGPIERTRRGRAAGPTSRELARPEGYRGSLCPRGGPLAACLLARVRIIGEVEGTLESTGARRVCACGGRRMCVFWWYLTRYGTCTPNHYTFGTPKNATIYLFRTKAYPKGTEYIYRSDSVGLSAESQYPTINIHIQVPRFPKGVDICILRLKI